MTATDAMTDDARDAARWRKLTAMIQVAYDNGMVENDSVILAARMLFGRGSYRRMEVSLSFADVRDEPVDLGAALDAFTWPPSEAPAED